MLDQLRKELSLCYFDSVEYGVLHSPLPQHPIPNLPSQYSLSPPYKPLPHSPITDDNAGMPLGRPVEYKALLVMKRAKNPANGQGVKTTGVCKCLPGRTGCVCVSMEPYLWPYHTH